jgi:hypothetical protein
MAHASFCRLAVNNEWPMEEGWCLYLVSIVFGNFNFCATCFIQQGCHFLRCGVEGLGTELQRRGITRHSQWGAKGITYVLRSHDLSFKIASTFIRNRLSVSVTNHTQYASKGPMFSSNVAVQTDSALMGFNPISAPPSEPSNVNSTKDREVFTLSAVDLAAILNWSKDISSDINLASGTTTFILSLDFIDICLELCGG